MTLKFAIFFDPRPNINAEPQKYEHSEKARAQHNRTRHLNPDLGSAIVLVGDGGARTKRRVPGACGNWARQ